MATRHEDAGKDVEGRSRKIVNFAPVSDSAPAAPARPISIRDIRIDGGDGLPPVELDRAAAPFIGTSLDQRQFGALLSAISGVAHDHGYIFARSSIPAQTIADGLLHVRLDLGHIDEIRLTGARNQAVKAILYGLLGHAPTRTELERRLMLAGDLPGVTIGSVRFAMERGRGVLIVPVTIDRIHGEMALDNRGDRELGPVRARLEVDFNGLLNDRDTLTVQGMVTPIQPRELNIVSGRYAYQIDNAGTEIAITASHARTHSGGLLHKFNVNGESINVGASIFRPLVRSRRKSLWLGGGLDYFAIDQWAFSHERIRRDRLTTANISINGYVPLAGGRLRAGAGITRGLGIFGATEAGDPLASRPGASGRFTLASFWANWSGDIAGPISARLTAIGQVSDRPLLAVSQLGLGGSIYGRGYDFSERSGDQGILGSAEIQVKLLSRGRGIVRGAQAYVFADGGRVTNLSNSIGTGSLYSAGFGVRLNLLEATRLTAEAAFPINAPRFDSGDKSPRLSASLTERF